MTVDYKAQYVQKDGTLTLEGYALLEDMAKAIEALQATIADHEARLEVLEP